MALPSLLVSSSAEVLDVHHRHGVADERARVSPHLLPVRELRHALHLPRGGALRTVLDEWRDAERPVQLGLAEIKSQRRGLVCERDGGERLIAADSRVAGPVALEEADDCELRDQCKAGPVISIVFSFRYGIYISLNSSTSAGHVYHHVYQYEMYLENTGRNQFRN